MTIHNILYDLQQKLKVPKGQTNNFGGYKYRSCEDIVEAVKKILPNGVTVTLSDSMVCIGQYAFVQSTATLTDGVDKIVTIGCARDPIEKKGSDASQNTGAASSYARKYALNGLFCIDDTKDADATNDHGKAPQAKTDHAPDPTFSPEAKSLQAEMITRINQCRNPDELDALWNEYGTRIDELPKEMRELVNLQDANTREALEKGITSLPMNHRFPSVEDQRNWVKRMMSVVKSFKSIKALEDWKEYNTPFIMGLSDKIKKGSEESLRAYFLRQIDGKATELSNINLANTPIG